jgi:hypothetical protein
MSKSKIYLELSPEVEQILADNSIDIEKILEQEQIEFEKAPKEQIPYQKEKGAQTKEIVTVILASSAAAAAIGFAIKQAISALNNRPIVVKAYDAVNAVNPDGTSETKLIENLKLLEPRAKDSKTTIELNFKLLGVIFKFSTEQKEINPSEPIGG